MMKLSYRGKQVLKTKCLTQHKEKIKKTSKSITSTVDTVKLYVSKFSIELSQGQRKN